MMKVVYVAGPYRAACEWDVEQNIQEAEWVAVNVWKRGAVALCPHKNTAHFGGACPDAVWLEGDLEMLRRCDALITTSGWKESTGACAEIEAAKGWGLPVFHTFLDLSHWLGNDE